MVKLKLIFTRKTDTVRYTEQIFTNKLYKYARICR